MYCLSPKVSFVSMEEMSGEEPIVFTYYVAVIYVILNLLCCPTSDPHENVDRHISGAQHHP